MTDQEIKNSIAYCYYQKFKKKGRADDSERDQRFADNVYKHFMSPIDPTNSKWLNDRIDYEEFQRFF